jgi:hypothetical protein
MSSAYKISIINVVSFIMLILHFGGQYGMANERPMVDAGLTRYAATEPVQLDGSNSHDPDKSGPLTYTWTQISGPPVNLSEADTATPTVSDFVQTDAVQKCEFELLVDDGELTSHTDRVCVVIVPRFGDSILRLENASFNADNPTIIYFGGGNCVIGYSGQYISDPNLLSKANVIDFPDGYEPDVGQDKNVYFHYGDMLIVYLSSVAPDYEQLIETSGWSTGGQPAIDVAIRMNTTYQDARYAVNQIHFFDATPFCRDYGDYSASIRDFLESRVDGEPCWADTYVSSSKTSHQGILNVVFDSATDASIPQSERHRMAVNWYAESLVNPDSHSFNSGVVAGEFWSVFGPGRNLQLARAPELEIYKFNWYGGAQVGHMELYDSSLSPGRLPEPVTLLGPENGAVVDGQGVVLSCQVSENAVGYQLLFGSDPRHLVYQHSFTDAPPAHVVNEFPFEKTWWTVKVRDEYGSTIYADPRYINAEQVVSQPILNSTQGKEYACIQDAINDAHPKDEIVISPGIFDYVENLNIKGKSLTLRSEDPLDPSIVGATVIRAANQQPVIACTSFTNRPFKLEGLTIAGTAVALSCREASPTIRNCTVQTEGPVAIEYWNGNEPLLVDCNVLGQVMDTDDPRLVASWELDETEGIFATDSTGDSDGLIFGNPVWQSEGGRIRGALQFDGVNDVIVVKSVLKPEEGPFSVFAWIKGGQPGQAIISQQGGVNWLQVDADGKLMTDLKGANRTSTSLYSEAVVTDGIWHRVGFVWDGSQRALYVDNLQVATDIQGSLAGSSGGLSIGAGPGNQVGSFWSGMIDDVRIYDRAVEP